MIVELISRALAEGLRRSALISKRQVRNREKAGLCTRSSWTLQRVREAAEAEPSAIDLELDQEMVMCGKWQTIGQFANLAFWTPLSDFLARLCCERRDALPCQARRVAASSEAAWWREECDKLWEPEA